MSDRARKATRFLRELLSLKRGVSDEARKPAFDGYLEQRNSIPLIDFLDDADLRKLNELLPWHSFVVDGHGRRFGNIAWKGKRVEPSIVPDFRVELLDERVALADEHVLEVGCFEGNHTVALAERAARVTAIDARIENVVKTIVRCAFFGLHPTVVTYDLENGVDPSRLNADVVFHVGVLYHLTDPATHLLELAAVTRKAILLDTHYAPDAEATESYRVNGEVIRYQHYREGGAADPFSGTREHAKWLKLDDLLEILHSADFQKTEVVERREERNGPRVMIVARKL